MAASSLRVPVLLICAAVLFAVAGCDKPARDDMSWAQGALERNATLQILTVDRQARAFTVRLKDTGELRIVQANEVIGSLPQAAPTVAAVSARVGAIVATDTGGGGAPPDIAAAAPATPAAAAVPVPAPGPAPTQVAVSAASAGPGVIASGPGYSIKSARADGAASARTRSFAANDSVARGVTLERRDEPIVCQGARFLRIDGRNLEFSGDAISAEDGCEIHITNSRIAASGVGVSARAANVHIENSTIEGQAGAILASDGAQVYAEASRFRGVSRGLNRESLHDLGGNVWN
jgi:hypothetical protein